MSPDAPAGFDEGQDGMTLAFAEQAEEATPSFESMLKTAVTEGARKIVSRVPLDQLREWLRTTKRFYLDLDGTLLMPGPDSRFDDYTLRMLRLILDNGGEVTFLTGKPLVEVERLIESMPDDIRDRVSILYEKGAYRYTKANPMERLLTTEAAETTMTALKEECFAEWKQIIQTEHNVILSPAGSGAHKSVLSIDLDKPDAVLAPDDPERMSAKIDPKDTTTIQAVIATLQRLIASKPRTLDLHITDLGNANLEIEITDIEKGAAVARLEHDKNADDHGRALVMDDSGNGQQMFAAGRFLPHVTNALVYHDTTPETMAQLADIAVTGKAQGALLLQKVAEAKGDTHDLIIISNTPSLERRGNNEFHNRMGAPVAIGGVVAQMRRAFWIFPQKFGPGRKTDDFSDYPDPRLQGKFLPVGITDSQHDSQYNRISNTDWWFWAHPQTFPNIERQAPEHMERYLQVSMRLADRLAESVTNGDATYVSTHDFQVLPVAAFFRDMHPDKDNVRFHLFWHVPIPPPAQAFLHHGPDELARRFRWFMAYDQIAFHTEEYKNNYLAICKLLEDRGIRPAPNVIVQPISIDVDAMRAHAIEVANAKDFRFANNRLNDFFQMDLAEDQREEFIMAPPERGDPIKGAVFRLRALLDIAEHHPHLLAGKRFLEIVVPSRLDSKPYADNYEEINRLVHAINAKVGRNVIHIVDRIDDRRDVAGAMQFANKAMFTSIEDGFNMTIPEALVNWGASRLIRPKIRRLIATARTGFILSLHEHGLMVPGKEAIPVAPSPALDYEGFRGKIVDLLSDKVPQPRYELLEMYFSRYTLQKWIERNVREHVRGSFPRGIEVAQGI